MGDRLAFVQGIAFLDEKLDQPAAGARRDMHFVHFNRARNRLNSRPAGGEEKKQKNEGRRAIQKRGSLQGAGRLPTSGGNEREAAGRKPEG